MSAVKDEAICLGCRHYAETSQLLTLFGRSGGQLRVLAKGSRRPRSRFAGGVDLLTAGRILYHPARSDSALHTLASFDLTNPFGTLRGDLLSLYCAQAAGELVIEFTEQMDPHETLYDALYQLLDTLGRPNQAVRGLFTFEWILLQEVGLMPQWRRCGLCRVELSESGRWHFSSRAGGLLCGSCRPDAGQTRLVPPAVRAILRDPTASATCPPPLVVDAHEVLSYHQRELLGKNTRMMKFLNPLLRKCGTTDHESHS
ncbi:MAG: DNA repair protein RecO [Sedimentisphaerales bacterium]|nr:DNA repair protein RecO [Sedimentisphaerales bacterium]